MNGYIKLHRKIISNPMWQAKPFSQGQAWIDLLLLAEWQDRSVEDAGETVTIPRGSLLTSTRELAERWGWSQSKASRFIRELKRLNMCVTKRLNKRLTAKTLIALVNYGDYQDTATAGDSRNDSQSDSQTDSLLYRKEEKRRNKRNTYRARAREKIHNFHERDEDLDAIVLEIMKGGKNATNSV